MGFDNSIIYFVDNIKYPINKTGRVLLSLENFGNRTTQLITFTRHNNTKILNSVQESWIGKELYTVVENLYSLNVMVILLCSIINFNCLFCYKILTCAKFIKVI